MQVSPEEVGIYKRKQENTLSTKKATKKRRKENTLSAKKAIKKKRAKKENTFFYTFFYKFSPLCNFDFRRSEQRKSSYASN